VTKTDFSPAFFPLIRYRFTAPAKCALNARLLRQVLKVACTVHLQGRIFVVLKNRERLDIAWALNFPIVSTRVFLEVRA